MTEVYQPFGPYEIHSPEWYAHRQLCIGASEVASILCAPGAFSTPLQVWAEKRGVMEHDEPTKEDLKERLHFGLALEPIIADEFSKRAGFVVLPEDKQFISVPYPFLGCSLDRWFREAGVPEEEKDPLDLKNAAIFVKEEWEGTVPLKYNIQVQAQMAVTGRDRAALAVLIGGNQFKWAIIERNEHFIEVMLEKLQKFWEMVQNDVMPEAVAKDNRYIGELLGKEKPGATIVLSTNIVAADAELTIVKEKIRDLNDRKNALEAMIKKEIGTNERGLLPEGGAYTFKTVERQGYTVQPSSSRQLRRLKG